MQLVGLASLIVGLGVATAYALHLATDTPIPTMVGILSGAVTNTPGLGAAQQAYSDASGINDPSIALGYAVAYPLGVIGIIYEARPNVTSDAAALCVKAGNAVILRGGKEAFRSNRAVVKVLREAVAASGLPADCIQLVEDTSRASSAELMGLTEYLDCLLYTSDAADE